MGALTRRLKSPIIFSRVSNDELAATIIELLDERGWSQRELETKAGLSHGYLSPLLSGRMKSKPKPATLARIAQAFSVPIAELSGVHLAGTDPKSERFQLNLNRIRERSPVDWESLYRQAEALREKFDREQERRK